MALPSLETHQQSPGDVQLAADPPVLPLCPVITSVTYWGVFFVFLSLLSFPSRCVSMTFMAGQEGPERGRRMEDP